MSAPAQKNTTASGSAKTNKSVVGIDLGTTYSLVAWVDAVGHPSTVINSEGDLTTPSVVFFDKSNVVVGKEAIRAAEFEPERIAQFAKRDMGRVHFHKNILGEPFPPEVIQALVLKKLKADAELKLGSIESAVITVPAYFDEPRRKATQDAGELAGIQVLDILNEPTAAAISYGVQQGFVKLDGEAISSEVVLVYDLGGGTFDVTLMEISGRNFNALATAGDVYLGGVDWTERIVDFIGDQFTAEHQVDPRIDEAGLQSLMQTAEDAKRALTARADTTVMFGFAGHRIRTTITRDQFLKLTSDLLERTITTTNRVLRDAKLEWQDVTRLLLVGGSSRMPAIADSLEKESGLSVDRSLSPDEAVGHGAAVYAALLAGNETEGICDIAVTNVNSHDLGILGVESSTGRNRRRIMIPRNTQLPCKSVSKFKTFRDNQVSVLVNVVEGGDASGNNSTPIGKCTVSGLPKDVKAGTEVEVAFRYSADGRIRVSAQLPSIGKAAKLDIDRATGLSPEQLAHWKGRIDTGITAAVLPEKAAAAPTPASTANQTTDPKTDVVDEKPQTATAKSVSVASAASASATEVTEPARQSVDAQPDGEKGSKPRPELKRRQASKTKTAQPQKTESSASKSSKSDAAKSKTPPQSSKSKAKKSPRTSQAAAPNPGAEQQTSASTAPTVSGASKPDKVAATQPSTEVAATNVVATEAKPNSKPAPKQTSAQATETEQKLASTNDPVQASPEAPLSTSKSKKSAAPEVAQDNKTKSTQPEPKQAPAVVAKTQPDSASPKIVAASAPDKSPTDASKSSQVTPAVAGAAVTGAAAASSSANQTSDSSQPARDVQPVDSGALNQPTAESETAGSAAKKTPSVESVSPEAATVSPAATTGPATSQSKKLDNDDPQDDAAPQAGNADEDVDEKDAPAIEVGEEDPEWLEAERIRARNQALKVMGVNFVLHAVALAILALIILPNDVLPQAMQIISSVGEEPPEQLLESEVEIQPEQIKPETKMEVVTDVILDTEDQFDIDVSDFEPEMVQQEQTSDTGGSMAPVGGEMAGRSKAGKSALVQKYGGTSESEAAVAAGLVWIKNHQKPNGSWKFDHRCPNCDATCTQHGTMTSSIGATSLALLAYMGAGNSYTDGEYQETVEAALNYVLQQAKLTQYGLDLRGDAGGNSGMYTHGIAAICLAEAYAMNEMMLKATPSKELKIGNKSRKEVYRDTKKLKLATREAIRFIANAQSKTRGGWRYDAAKDDSDTSVVGWQVMALKSAKSSGISVPSATLKGVDLYLNSVTKDGALYGYTTPAPKDSTTAIGLLCRVYLGWKRKTPGLQRGVEYLSGKGPNFGNMYYNYYATQVMHQWGGEEWGKWNKVMREHLVKSQVKKGHASGSWNLADPHGGAGGRLYMTCLATMTLEVYYRHLPLYQQLEGAK